MSYISILSERAKKELQESWEWYEERQPGLGDRFIAAVFEKLNQLEDDPAKGMQRNTIYREAMVKIFPYLIIYRIETTGNCIFVHSIFHSHRNPNLDKPEPKRKIPNFIAKSWNCLPNATEIKFPVY